MRTLILAAAACALLPSASIADSFTIEPGKYKTTMTMKMAMMPGGGMTNTSEHCVTPEDATKTPEDIVTDMGQGGNCSASDVSSSSNSMAFSFKCTGGDMGDMSGRYEMNMSNDRYSFKGDIKGNMQGMQMDMSMDGKAERIGNC